MRVPLSLNVIANRIAGNLFSLIEMVSKGISWVSIVSLPLIVSVSDFGLIALLYSAEIVIGNLGVLGQDKYKLRHGVEKGGDPSYLVSLVFVTAVSVLVLVGVNYFYQNSLMLVGILLVGSIFSVVNRVHTMEARVTGDVKGFALHRFGVINVRFGLLYLLLMVGVNPALAFVASFAVSAILFSFRRFMTSFFQFFGRDPSWSRSVNKAISFGAPVSVHLVAASLLGHVDRFLINKYLGAHDVGVYAFSFMLASGITFFYAALAVQIEPLIYRYSGDFERREGYIRLFGKWALLLLPVYCVVLGFAGFVYERLGGDIFDKVDLVVLLVALSGSVLNVVYLQSSYRLYALKRSASISAVTVVTCLVNVCVNWVAIPVFGMRAAAFSFLISSSLLALTMSFVSLSAGGIKQSNRDFITLLAVWVFSVGVIMLVA